MVAPARRLDGALRVHVQIDQIVDDLEIGLRLFVGARTAADGEDFVAAENHIGIQRMRGALAGLERVGFLRIETEAAQAVVHDHAGIAGDHARAERREDALNQ